MISNKLDSGMSASVQPPSPEQRAAGLRLCMKVVLESDPPVLEFY
jgi:hypothetical protein